MNKLFISDTLYLTPLQDLIWVHCWGPELGPCSSISLLKSETTPPLPGSLPPPLFRPPGKTGKLPVTQRPRSLDDSWRKRVHGKGKLSRLERPRQEISWCIHGSISSDGVLCGYGDREKRKADWGCCALSKFDFPNKIARLREFRTAEEQPLFVSTLHSCWRAKWQMVLPSSAHVQKCFILSSRMFGSNT